MPRLPYLPKAGALLSLLGSGLIIAEVIQDSRQRGASGNIRYVAFGSVGAVSQVLLSMSAGDILFSLGWFLASWAVRWSKAICVFQGFMIQLGYMASLLSNASLAVVYLLMIHYSWHQRRIQTKIPCMMLILWSFCLSAALVPLALDMYHDAGPTCWIAAQDGTLDSSFLVFSLQLVPIWSCIILDSVIMFLIFRKTRLLEAQVEHADHYQESLDLHTETENDHPAMTATGTCNIVPNSKKQIDLSFLPDVNANHLGGSECLGDSESHHGVFSFVEFTPFDPYPMLFPYQDEAGGCEMNTSRSMFISSIVSHTSGAHDPREDQEEHVEDYRIPLEEQVSVQLEEQHPETAITREPPQGKRVTSNQSDNNIHHIEPCTNIYSASTSECSADSTPNSNRPRSHKRSQIVAQQGMWYIAGFFMTYGIVTISVLVFLISGEWNEPLDHASYFFLSCQGVFNFLVFSHGRRQMKTWLGAKLKSWIWKSASYCRSVCHLLKQLTLCPSLSSELEQSTQNHAQRRNITQHEVFNNESPNSKSTPATTLARIDEEAGQQQTLQPPISGEEGRIQDSEDQTVVGQSVSEVLVLGMNGTSDEDVAPGE
ncbi:expressed unknown protein [Seminavis robusta]|uniref:G-protein coupled receptors family 2 profile 2 domain-containing protein n=1 Tax=Seminavis robusta TaxID=568900 RepID=A0A9N8DM74_9STRA|nr:expressed unknown protein [Seminavis robusta]|eukprot:Sro158_g071440.1 n/a (598) ;mRNA; r:8120-9999